MNHAIYIFVWKKAALLKLYNKKLFTKESYHIKKPNTWSKCLYSRHQLVGQKYQDKTTLASKNVVLVFKADTLRY